MFSTSPQQGVGCGVMLTDRGAAGARMATTLGPRGEGGARGGRAVGSSDSPPSSRIMALRSAVGGRVFEVLDTVDFGSKPTASSKITGREGFRTGASLLRRCGNIKSVSGASGQAAKRWHEEKVLAPSSSATTGEDLVDLLSEGQPDVAAIVTRANKADVPARTMVRARRTRAGVA
mmetsp:Transcript_2525/g.5624  ORF Transcript_2525/g.5624 Transcript_2525/m.5624 type:complete len:176 (+) Transcript_2525:231-758(+)